MSKPTAKRPTRSRTRKPVAKTYEMRAVSAGGFFIETPDAISAQTAIRVTAILSCVRFIAQSLASCPARIMRNLGGGRRQEARDLGVYETLSAKPNFWQSSYEFFELMGHWCALWGNAYARIAPGERGAISSLLPIHPSRIREKFVTDRDGRPVDILYEYWGLEGSRTLGRDEVLHFRWLSDNGYSGLVPAELCATAIGLARKLDTAAAAYWDNSARPDVVLETEEKVPDEAMAALRRQWREMYGGTRNRGATAVLPRKVQAKVLAGSSSEASQFMELRNAVVGEIARAFGIPSSLIGHEAAGRWASVEQEFISAQVFTLLPWQRRFEQAIDRSLLSGYPGTFCKLDNRGLLRGDTAARAALYQSLFSLGSLKPNEVRALEDLEILEDDAADKTYMQLGFAPLGTNAPAAAATVADEPPPAAADEPAPVDPSEDPVAAAGGDLAATALNGAQVTGLLEILGRVSAGLLEPEAAVAVIVAAFPTIDAAAARTIVAGAKAAPTEPTQGGPTDGA